MFLLCNDSNVFPLTFHLISDWQQLSTGAHFIPRVAMRLIALRCGKISNYPMRCVRTEKTLVSCKQWINTIIAAVDFMISNYTDYDNKQTWLWMAAWFYDNLSKMNDIRAEIFYLQQKYVWLVLFSESRRILFVFICCTWSLRIQQMARKKEVLVGIKWKRFTFE